MTYKILDIVGYYSAKKAIKHKLYCRHLRKEDAKRKAQIEKQIFALEGNQLKRQDDAGDIIVSLTSYGVRVTDTLPYALYSLLQQSRIPNRIVVWLDNVNWNRDKLPEILKHLQSLGVEFYYVDDLRSYKKLIPALKMFPDNIIITVDDDMYCNTRLVEWLLDEYKASNEKCVVGTWAFVEEKINGGYLPYSQWKDKVIAENGQKYSLIGCGGVLYPPHIFDEEIFNEDVFMKLAPYADDLWFWAMEKRLGIPVRLVPNARYGLNTPINKVDSYDPFKEGSLFYINEVLGNNNAQFKRLIDYYHLGTVTDERISAPRTKLVYVLTCSPNGTYIEQALMSVWSARYHNPNAHIVLLVDDKTDKLLTGKRAELLNYITEKIVVPFDDENASMKYRSRWIKTSVRQLIDGDFLYIDSDTLICGSLNAIDDFDCEIGATWESHLLVEDFCDDLMKSASEATIQVGVDLNHEKEYFSSGVLYVKDSPTTHQIYEQWHKNWEEGFNNGLSIDQPALAKANIDLGYVIKRIPDIYNCIVFTQNTFTAQALILHIASYQNPSFLFTDIALGYIKTEGLTDWIKDSVLRSCDSMLPFDYVVRHSSFWKRLYWIKMVARDAKTMKKNFPELLDGFPMQSSLKNKVIWLFKHRLYITGAVVWMSWKRINVLRKHGLKANVCHK